MIRAALVAAFAVSATAADRVRWYETRGVLADADALADWSKASYWSAKLRQQADVKLLQGGPQDGMARDALLSAVSSWLSAAEPRDGSEWVFAVDLRRESGPQIGARVRLDRTVRPPQLELAPFLFDERVALSAGDGSAAKWGLRFPVRHSSFPGGMETFCDRNVDVCSVLFQRLE